MDPRPAVGKGRRPSGPPAFMRARKKAEPAAEEPTFNPDDIAGLYDVSKPLPKWWDTLGPDEVEDDYKLGGA